MAQYPHIPPKPQLTFAPSSSLDLRVKHHQHFHHYATTTFRTTFVCPSVVVKPASLIRPTCMNAGNDQIALDFINPARTAVVTGATGGIGSETCKGLARIIPTLEKLIICCRPPSPTNESSTTVTLAPLMQTIQSINPKLMVSTVYVDLSDIPSILSCSSSIKDILDNDSLDLLICNAGIMGSPLNFCMNEIESQYFVNYLSHTLLIEQLIDSIEQSINGRIILVSSLSALKVKDSMNVPIIQQRTNESLSVDNYSPMDAYRDSKLAMSLYARALTLKLPKQVQVVSLHPGVVQTQLAKYMIPNWLKPILMPSKDGSITWINKLTRKISGMLLLPEEGAALSLKLCTVAEHALQNGALYLGLEEDQIAAKEDVPLLYDSDACLKLYNDTRQFIHQQVNI